MKKIIGFLTLLFLLNAVPGLRGEEQKMNLSAAKDLRAQADVLEKEWLEHKKEYKKKYEVLIGQAEQDLARLEEATDNGDVKLRKQINEAIRDTARERDGLKRRLAELSAANAVDIVKMKERIHDKIADIKD